MSDSSKPQRPGATPIKNPLLSASVTGLTFDDFPNKPLLLPAAPPIVHAPPPPAPSVTPSALLGREHKSLVTVGSSSLDTEHLDEINLNASNEDSTTSDTSDANANSLLEQPITSDSILSQAASSFSALPSVASNVFSSFSKRITAISSRETTPGYEQSSSDSNANIAVPHLDIQPTYTQQLPPQFAPAPEPFYAPPPAQGGSYFGSLPSTSAGLDSAQTSLPPLEPPRLYTPGEVTALPTAAAATVPPPTAGGQNNFRLSAKKKLYAPIPGLSDQGQQAAPTFDPSAVNAPISYDPTYATPYPEPYAQQTYPSEERKSAGGGLFSKITNLAPSGVLQNITGLVQSAAGTITQTIKSDSSQSFEQPPYPSGQQQFDQQPTNYFAAAPHPPAGNYFAPPAVAGQQGNYPTPFFSQGSAIQPPAPAATIFNPPTATQKPSEVSFFDPTKAAAQLPSEVNFFDPSKAPTIFDPTSVAPNPSEHNRPSTQATSFFNEPYQQLPPAPSPSAANSAQLSRPPSQPSRPSSQPGVSAFVPQQIPPASFNSSLVTPGPSTLAPTSTIPLNNPTAAPVGFYDPTKYIPTNQPSTQIGVTTQTTQPLVPPTAATGTGLPPPPGGQTSYRLQKGTKLYKNPLTAQETAPVQVAPHQIAANPVFAAPPLFGGPAGQPTPAGIYDLNATQHYGPSFAATPVTQVPNLFVPAAEAQSVPLFAPVEDVNKPEENNDSVSLSTAPIEETANSTREASVPLVSAAPSEHTLTQSVPFFSAPAKVEDKFPVANVSNTAESSEQTTGTEELTTADPSQGLIPGDNINSAYFFKPIEPVIEQDPKPTNQCDTIQSSVNFFGSNEESHQFFKPIEPVVETDPATDVAEDSLSQTLQQLSLTSQAQSTAVETTALAATETESGPIPSVSDTTSSTANDPITLPPQPSQGLIDTHPPLTAAAAAVPLVPPPVAQTALGAGNPYRRGSVTETTKPSVVQPSLANFFTPATSGGSGDFNFFSTLPTADPASGQPTGEDFFSSAQVNAEATHAKGGNKDFFNNPQIENRPDTQTLSFFESAAKSDKCATPQLPVDNFLASSAQPKTDNRDFFNTSQIENRPGTQTLGFFEASAKSDESAASQLPPDNFFASSTQVNAEASQPKAVNKDIFNINQIENISGPQTLSFFEAAAKSDESAVPPPNNFFASADSGNKSEVCEEPAAAESCVPQNPTVCLFPPLPTNIGIIPSVLETAENIQHHQGVSNLPLAQVPPPIGFENFVQNQSQQQPPTADNTTGPSPPIATAPQLQNQVQPLVSNSLTPENTTQQAKAFTVAAAAVEQPQIVNSFSNFFSQTPSNQPQITKDTSSFFDSFAPGQTQPQQQQQVPKIPTTSSSQLQLQGSNEDQRIQNFFNNPPPKDADHAGDLNYDLVHSGLAIRNLQQRSLTPVSNLVEPPSSACSEFSTLTSADTSIVKDDSKVLEETLAETKHYEELPEEILKELRMSNLLQGDKMATTPPASVSYKPAVKHWFYKRTVDAKQIWTPFSHYDSALLETSLSMEGDDKPSVVAVEGGRYDVNISERLKRSVYWDSKPIEVRRCSWFYKAIDSKYIPYEENTAEVLEGEYKQAAESGVWHKTIILGMGEQVVFHGPTVIVHFQQQQNQDAWGGTTQSSTRPRVVKRDLDDFRIEQGESQKVDHLLFMVHGIGSGCDLKLRSVEEVVEDFRSIAHQLVLSHYKNSADLGLVGRVEVLPISWHNHLHSLEAGIDEKLRSITLESIPKLRNFTNDTLLDVLFYTSPTFAQRIMNSIVRSLNDIYLKYRQRHPEFSGGVSLAGHSLGSLILFDLLCHQKPLKECEESNLENPDQEFMTNAVGTDGSESGRRDSNPMESKHISYTMGPAGTGQPFISYGQLIFQPKKFFALGSPVGMFVTIRGIDTLGMDFRLPTCTGFYNIFHPYDPVAYRMEALVNPDLSGVRPVLIPHHKGRKRMHLELKETMARVSMDLKQRFLDKFKNTFESVNIFGTTAKTKKETEELMEKEVEKVIEMQMQLERQDQPQQSQTQNLLSPSDEQRLPTPTHTNRSRNDSVSTVVSEEMAEIDLPLGKLNDSKRIDYVLQEAPLEFINEYIFALSSHVCYWDSEDTILFVMKEIYSGLGISPDSQVPQQTMTIERPSSRNSLSTL